MFAMVIDGFGGAERLRPAELPIPAPGPGQVRVRVVAAGVNPADWKTREGFLSKYITYAFPFVLGFDLAGVVDALGEGVEHPAVGTRVFGTSMQGQGQNGSCAEYTLAHAAMLQPIPDTITFAEAAVLATAGTTALGGLVDLGGLTAGQSVLIHGGAGGVGSIALQIAKAIGARVLTTCSAHNADYVLGLGADLAIDYHNRDVAAACGAGVDLVLDAVGQGSLLPRATDIVRPGGTFVEIETLLSAASEQEIARAAASGVRVVSNMIAIDRLPDQLRRLRAMVAEGAVIPPLTQTMPLRDLAEAHRRIEAGHQRGKIALIVSAD